MIQHLILYVNTCSIGADYPYHIIKKTENCVIIGIRYQQVKLVY